MKKTRLWALLLVALLALLCAPAQAAPVASGYCGTPNAEDASWTLSDAGELVITGTGKIEYGEWNRDAVKTLRVERGITETAYAIFSSLRSLTAVSLPDTLTTIDERLFSRCTSLTSVFIPDSVTYLGSGTFWGCTSLTGVHLPKHAETVWTRHMFRECASLKSIVLPECFTSVSMSMFKDCTALKNVTLPSTLVSIGDSDGGATFEGCTALEEIVLPAGVKTIRGQSFYGCTNLKRVVWPDNLETIEYLAFGDCAFENLDLPEGLKSIGDWAFRNCRSLKSIAFPSTLEAIESATMGDLSNAFEGCVSLTSLVIPDGISMGKNVFQDCTGLTYVSLPGTLGTVPPLFPGCTALREVEIREGVTKIDEDAFKDLPALQTVTFPSTIIRIEDNAFQGCAKLTNLSLPAELTTIGAYAFQGCAKLTLPDGLPKNLYYTHEHAFDGCTSLTSLTLDDDMLYDGAFANCTGLTSVVYLMNNDELHDRVFSGCTSLTDVNLPEAIKYGSGEYMFEGCTSLQSIHVPLFREHGDVVPAGFLSGCTALRTVYLPVDLTAIQANAFQNCGALTDVYFDGTREQWDALTIAEGNDVLGSAAVTIHCADSYIPFGSTLVEITGQGTVTPNAQIAEYRQLLRLTVTPAEGYLLTHLSAKDARGQDVDMFRNSGTYRFYHTSQYVAVRAVFKPAAECTGGTETSPKALTADDCPTVLYSGWYALSGNVTVHTRMDVQGDVHLVLGAGKTLTAASGIGVNEGNTLTISGSGALNAAGQVSNAGIGGDVNKNGGTVVIEDGVITAHGELGGAGIGGSNRNASGTVVLNGGTVTATGSAYGGTIVDGVTYWFSGSGIGCGSSATGGTVVLNGGVIRAVGGSGAPGIGGGITDAGSAPCDLTIADGLAVTPEGADAPALYAGRADACLSNVVDVAPCGHDGESVPTDIGGKLCLHCNAEFGFPDFGARDFSLPANLTAVGDKAFAGAAMTSVYLHDGCVSVGARAFAGCPNLVKIRVPAACLLSEDAFDGCPRVYLYGTPDSPAETYCDDPAHDNCVFVPAD